ncbi:2Fe-2S ferredoxin [Gemmata obscuriglobus]|uniref:Ferredoxin n=1 Tax=Gemmata obscuriglobus TaxID=114 RepID=A0A2Z3H639_9BACT|nr:2Fe-2S iron-sulfur cluster-binding protein [Gemmata obscuriglobus]AWM41218.1 ferredoxin [Gemmata obscuriglobus]QEG25440.1 2Fe-2S ferredoxin [Gemmata obscuriglobus]VTR98585.1 ferredoxin : 2Fe-2S ferredoxin OS=Candidatus Nitrospira defluvii GN=fdxB PE=4 SV=1: Fer2 [Gemmata obscuriglobus UQM 2246]
MAGINPYIQKASAQKAAQPFKVTFVDEATGKSTEVVVDPATFPFGNIGLDGSVLDIADGAGIEINHSCGGVCACSTCHVHVQKGGSSCSNATDDEEDELDQAPALSPDSRLACQCVPNGTQDLIVLIPKWNRNEVKEGHH